MSTKRAKVLNDDQLAQLVKHIDETSILPERDRLLVMLSFKAGLRASEIAKIDIRAMTDVEGRPASTITIFSNVGKKKRERTVPMHPEISRALKAFQKRFPHATFPAISSQPFRFKVSRLKTGPITETKFRRMSPMRVTNYLGTLMKATGFDGTSSHSGRRTFCTALSRKVNLHHCSLRDVQRLMGHVRLETTEAYMELSDDTFALVAAI